jgi:basic amino acid/polyamine antiporter, APA family
VIDETQVSGESLQKIVGLGDLTALGLGAIIGTGIFIVIGEAITESGPSIILSFVLAGITCAFSALCYAELASSIPVAGSAYTYAYVTMGELAAGSSAGTSSWSTASPSPRSPWAGGST